MDARYNLDRIMEDSCLPKFNARQTYDWYLTRIYSIIDITDHPLHFKAKQILQNHLNKLKHKDDQSVSSSPASNHTESSLNTSQNVFPQHMAARAHGFKDTLSKPLQRSPVKQPTQDQPLKKRYDDMKDIIKARFDSMAANAATDAERRDIFIERDNYMLKLDRQYH